MPVAQLALRHSLLLPERASVVPLFVARCGIGTHGRRKSQEYTVRAPPAPTSFLFLLSAACLHACLSQPTCRWFFLYLQAFQAEEQRTKRRRSSAAAADVAAAADAAVAAHNDAAAAAAGGDTQQQQQQQPASTPPAGAAPGDAAALPPQQKAVRRYSQQRSLLAAAVAAATGDSSAAEEPSFDPIGAHRSWCPWVTQHLDDNSSMSVGTNGVGINGVAAGGGLRAAVRVGWAATVMAVQELLAEQELHQPLEQQQPMGGGGGLVGFSVERDDGSSTAAVLARAREVTDMLQSKP